SALPDATGDTPACRSPASLRPEAASRSGDSRTADAPSPVATSSWSVPPRRREAAPRSAACCVVDRPLGTLGAPRPQRSAADPARLSAFEKGLPVSLRDMLQHLDVQRLVSYDLPLTPVLVFPFLSPPDLLRLHHTAQLPLAALRRLTHI